MSTNNHGRVLSRWGAREVTVEELEKIVGGNLHTLLSAIFTSPVTHPDEHLDQ